MKDLFDEDTILTLELFNNLPDGKSFARGIAENSTNGIFMNCRDAGRMLKWIAKKGYGNDFAIYCLWDDLHSYEDVLSFGEKIFDKEVIKRLINCDDAVLQRYRR